MNITVDDLYRLIGELYVDRLLLQRRVKELETENETSIVSLAQRGA